MPDLFVNGVAFVFCSAGDYLNTLKKLTRQVAGKANGRKRR